MSLPTEIVDIAEAAITGAVNVFNDIESGAIVEDLEKIPGVIVSDITNAWGDLTSGLEDGWNAATDAFACLFGDCPVTTTAAAVDRNCGGTQPITAQTIQPTPPPLPTSEPPTQTRPKSSSSPVMSSQLISSPTPAANVAGGLKLDRTIVRLNFFQLCWFLGLVLLGAIFLL